MGVCCCKRNNEKKKIVLLLLGLDNAGKTRAANGLAGERSKSPVPTVGFSVIDLKHPECKVKIFDLGGGSSIRGIWQRYFYDAHGIIFVIDSSDLSRLNEVKTVFEETIIADQISGKPMLILANKQDNEHAIDEIDLIEFLNIEYLVNKQKCPTLVQSCSATESNKKLDPGIQKGYEWLLNNILKNYNVLNKRVEEESEEQFRKDKEEILSKMSRIKRQRAMDNAHNEDLIETYSDYVRKMNNEQILNVKTVEEEQSSSGSSSSSLPSVHVNHNFSLTEERPKSAVQIIKHQLQLNPPRKRSIKKSNKTSPVYLYGSNLPRSARERRRDFSVERRNLRSADDCFVKNNKIGPGGDHKEEMRYFKENGEVPWTFKPIHKGDIISIIDCD